MSQPVSEAVSRIEVYSRWIGFADPPMHAAKLTIQRQGSRFICDWALHPTPEDLPAASIERLLVAFHQRAIPSLDPLLFDLPPSIIFEHYGSCWTDDHPAILVRVQLASGQTLEARSEAQYAFMLPFRITTIVGVVDTYNPEVSRAVSAILPEGFLERERLSGERLQAEAKDYREPEPLPAVPEPPPADPPPPFDQEAFENANREVLRILFGEESPEEKAEAEAAGRISERLLKRLNCEEVRDLIARGADVNIADDRGQTALMNASWPPFDREKFRLLVEAGAVVDARRYDGCTGLHIACAGGEAETAAEWVRAGADVNASTPEGETPLMLGATWPRIVEMLLRQGADVKAVDAEGHTALAYCVVKQRTIVVDDYLRALGWLLAAGSNPVEPNRDGMTPLDHAAQALARVRIEYEAARAFHPDARTWRDGEWDDIKLAETVLRRLRRGAKE